MSANHKAQQPIGIFDSGIGGLTVTNAIRNLMPEEHLIYYGDTAHMPYGEKSADAIKYYSLKISKFLLDQNCKSIVIACNSASSAAYNTLLDFFDGRVIFTNVVDPLVEEVARKKYKNIGVIATKATIASNVYRDKIKHVLQKSNVHSLATPLLAPMIEEGFYQGKVPHTIIESYLSNPNFQDLDALLLACTHYPLIKDEISTFFNNKVDILDSTDIVARSLYQSLKAENLLNTKRTIDNRFYVSDLTESFKDTAANFYGSDVLLEVENIW